MSAAEATTTIEAVAGLVVNAADEDIVKIVSVPADDPS